MHYGCREWKRRHLHEQTSLSAGTVANDDELASDFSHAGPVYTSAGLASVWKEEASKIRLYSRQLVKV